MNRMWRTVAAGVLAGAAGAGCYTVGPLMPAGVHTVALPLIENHTTRRDLEAGLTQALARELQTRGLRLVTGGDADAVCHVRVTAVQESTTAEGPDNQSLQGRITVVADVVLRDRHGTVLVDRRGLRETDTYLLTAGETEETSLARAALVLARRIANALESAF